MNNILKSISPDTLGYFSVSHWFFWMAISLFIVLSIAILLINRFKGRIWALVSGLISGALLLILFVVLLNTNNIDTEVIEQTNLWLGLPGFIFIRLVMIMIPIFLFFIVSSLVMSEHFIGIKKRTYGVSFLSLLSLSVFGILIAMLMIPLIALIPDSLWITSSPIGGAEEGIWWLWILFLVIILVSFFGSLITRLILKDKIESINNFISTVLKYITMYFKILVFFIPMIAMGQLSIMGLSEKVTSDLALVAIYMGIFWLGALIIFGVLFSMNILLSSNELTPIEKTKIIFEQLATVFAYQSTQASLPETQNNLQRLGVCEEISKLTPTKGVFMGMVMCNGFAPMIMLEMILASAGMLTILNVMLVAIIVFSLAISTSGAGSADYFIITTAIGMMNGINTDLYLSVLLPAQEINERTITRPNNSLGHMYATLLTEKYHHKVSGESCENCLEEK